MTKFQCSASSERLISRQSTTRSFLAVSRIIATLFLLLFHDRFPSDPLHAEDWPTWRGPNRNDLTSEPSGWNGSTWAYSTELWRRQVDQGGSSPIVVGDKLYVFGWSEDQERLRCLKVEDGSELWTQSYSAPIRGRHATGDEGLYGGPSSTPVYDSGTQQIYTLGNDGDLHCRKSETGELVWEKNLYDTYKIPQRNKVFRSSRRDYGFTSSPLIVGESLLVEVGAPTGTLIAFDRRSGKEIWRSEATSAAGHTGGPALLKVDNKSCAAVFTYDGLLVTGIESPGIGKTVASVDWKTDFVQNIASPTTYGNSVVITSGYNLRRMSRFDIEPGNARAIWEIELNSTICSPVVHKGRLYWACQQIHCVDFATGKSLWRTGKVGDAGSCIVTSDDRIIVLATRGELLLLDSAVNSPDKPTVLARTQIEGMAEIWPHVVLANGRLYSRDRVGTLVCNGAAR
jgi:outer membrane protein assembly factor BamB